MTEKRFYGSKLITYRPYTSGDFERIQQVGKLTAQQRLEVAVIANVFPFKTNNYVLNELITWNDPLQDPMFRYAFTQKKMLPQQEYNEMMHTLFRGAEPDEIKATVLDIRKKLGLIPALRHANPVQINNTEVPFLHHRPNNALAFSPATGQNAYAWCAFCPGWPQYITNQPFTEPEVETEALTHYLRLNPTIDTLVFSGGEPLGMTTSDLAAYLNSVLNSAPAIKCITFETRSLAQWPYRFILDTDAGDLLDLFKTIVRSGTRIVIHQHFALPVELSTKAAALAIQQLKNAGAEVLTHTCLLPGINDTPETLAALWKKQDSLGCVVQDLTLFSFNALSTYRLALVKAHEIYSRALSLHQNKGPENGLVIYSTAGKIAVAEVNDSGIQLRFIQGKNPEWNGRDFTAALDENAVSVETLRPLDGAGAFFFEEELKNRYALAFTSAGQVNS